MQAGHQQANEHSIQRNAQCRGDQRRQQPGCNGPQPAAQRPGKIGAERHGEKVPRRARGVGRGGVHGKGFVRNAKSGQHTHRQPAALHLVEHAGTHDDMPQVQDKCCQHNGQHSSALRHHTSSHHLAGTTVYGQGHQHRLPGVQARLARHYAIGNAHRHIPQHNGHRAAGPGQPLLFFGHIPSPFPTDLVDCAKYGLL